MHRLFLSKVSRRWMAPAAAIALTLTTGIGLGGAVYTTASDQTLASQKLVQLTLLSGEIARLDEALTASARLSAASGDLVWKNRYDADVPRLDAAIKEAMALSGSPVANAALAETAASNLRLIELETAGFEAVRAGRVQQARAIVLGGRYQALKAGYTNGLTRALHALRDEADRRSSETRGRLLLLLIVGTGAFMVIAGLWLIILRDGTRRAELRKARKELQELDRRKSREGRRLAAARDVAESANRAKSEFLANISHELRTPLNGVLGVAGALSNTSLTASQKEMTGLIVDSAQTLNTILSDILDLSKIEAGRLSIEEGPFDLVREVGSICDLMRTRADERGLKFNLRIDPATEGIFIGDALRIKQVIANLLSNAIKFTPKGSVTMTVDAIAPGDGDGIRLQVSDTGIGFDSATSAKLFDRFGQADGSITRRFGGTGLGLSICQSLSELMGGSILATSEPGRGSVFTVELPLGRGISVDPGQAVELPPALPVDQATGGLRILLAEDHLVNQRVVDLILRPYGVALTIVDDGEQALAAMETGVFDVVLMDMQMPVMDGLTAIAAIRRLEMDRGLPRIPIAMLSANAMDEHRRLSLAGGADMHISKPFTPETLVAQIQDLLEIGDHAGTAGRPVADLA